MSPLLESLSTVGAGKSPEILVNQIHMRCKPAFLGKVLATELTANLATNAVSAEMVSQGISVRVGLTTHIAGQVGT